MKKVLFVLLAMILVASFASGADRHRWNSDDQRWRVVVAPTVDVSGAHNNYGRGCAGCHAPHSGAYGAAATLPRAAQ